MTNLRRHAMQAPDVEASIQWVDGDESLSYSLTSSSAGGLCVERVRAKSARWRVVQTMSFADGAGFARWCEEQDLRFKHPLLYSKLLRDGRTLLPDTD